MPSSSSSEMPLRWLHLSDIHMGCRGEEYFAGVKKTFFESVRERIQQRKGPPDLILITGDIANRGQAEEYAAFDAFLAELRRECGGEPLVIPVPGNHDVVRPKGSDKSRFAFLNDFSRGEDNPYLKELIAEVWEKEKDARFFDPLFKPYQDWLKRTILPQFARTGVQHHCSHFPGDLRVDLALQDRPPLTVVGLNSAWRHFQDIERGKLELFRQQWHHVGGDPPLLDDRPALLLMHHPHAWLSDSSQGYFDQLIYPPGQLLAFLHGHLHRGRAWSTSDSGGKDRHFFQSPPLFGVDEYGSPREFRTFGYVWGELERKGAIRLWPMRYEQVGLAGKFVFDQAFAHADETSGYLLRPGRDAPSSLSPVAEDEEIAQYRREALKTYGSIALIGTRVAEVTLDLGQVYVPLHISQRSELADPDRRKERPSREFERHSDGQVALKDVFRKAGKGRHAALFGDPGSGKTTAMRKLLHHCLAEGPQVLGLEGETLPLFLRLRRFSEDFLSQPLADYIEHELQVSFGGRLPVGLGKRLWTRGRLLLLFDGLDEIADQGLRAKVAHKLDLDLGREQARGMRAAVSCRHAGYGGPVRLGKGFLHLDVQPLDAEQVKRFVELWFREAHLSLKAGDPVRAERDAATLNRNLWDERYANPRITLLASNPLLLTLLCVVVMDKVEIPKRRVEFYQECLEVLLYRWRHLPEEEAPPFTLESALAVLRKVAWTMHAQGRQYDLGPFEFNELAEEVLANYGFDFERQSGFAVLRWLHVTCGMLEEFATEPEQYGFMHLGFQEYLAARHLASERKELMGVLGPRAGEPWWKEVILLLAGLEDRDLFVQLVTALLGEVKDQKRAELLRAVVLESPVAELEPFLVPLRQGDAATQAAVLRLLTGRRDPLLRQEAERLVRACTTDADKADEVRDLAQRFLDQARPREEEVVYDALLVFAPGDRARAEEVARALAGEGLRLWPVADESWTGLLLLEKEQWRQWGAVVVLVGRERPWEDRRTRGALALLARRRRMAPVLLAGQGDFPPLPEFMRDAAWVDGRRGLVAGELARRVRGETSPAPSPTIPAMPQGVFQEPKTGIRFLPVPGGEFLMGSDTSPHKNERPAHPVILSPYALGETPVTNQQYGVFLREAGSREPAYWRDSRFADPEQPVVGIAWEEARAFCRWLAQESGRQVALPSEAQWEFAARGTEGREYPWGQEAPDEKRAYFGNPSGKPALVGSHPAGRGPFGHLDLAGNVWEWCLDGWLPDYERWKGAPPRDPVVTEGDVRVMRGGSWVLSAGYLRSAFRRRSAAPYRYVDLGFRVAVAPASR